MTKLQGLFLVLAALLMTGTTAIGQSSASYLTMSQQERSAFVAAQARRVAREISGRDYQFTAEFEADIQRSLDAYAQRLNPSAKHDLRVVLQRGRTIAPTLAAAFRARNVSTLYGLYIPFVESEYVNLESSGTMGSVGIFQFLPSTGENYGLSVDDLMDVSKSADAAARYITDSLEFFKNDPTKEALAILAYNRGNNKIRRELKSVSNDQNRACSICALSAERSKLDDTFKQESVFYVPRFFAAAIIGENPQAFGLPGQPLSSY